jgi:hypothetical protein
MQPFPIYPNYDFVDVMNIQLPKGWVMLGIDLLHEFNTLRQQQLVSRDFTVQSMKELYGTLDVKLVNPTLISVNIVKGFSLQASRTCQDCGYYPSAMHKRNKWLRVLCTECARKSHYALV